MLKVASFVAGKFSPAANLLHVCTQHNLSQSLDMLLQPWFIEDKAHYLLQKGLDNKTPVDIAKKNNLTTVSEIADQLVVRTINNYIIKRHVSVWRTLNH